MLKKIVIEGLRNRFGEAVRIKPESNDFAIFPAKHPSVGDVVIEEDGNELIVSVGDITHGHFGSYESGLSEAEHGAVIAEALLDFLHDLFADKLLLFKATWGGGWTLPEYGNENDLKSKNRQWFKWSGPIDFRKQS